MIGSPHLIRGEDTEDMFVFHAFNAVMADNLQYFHADVQDDMTIVIVDKLINQMRQEFRRKFLSYVEARIKGH